MRGSLTAVLAILLLSSSAFAQGASPQTATPAAPATPVTVPGTVEQSLQADPNVRQSQDPHPTAQGTRPPHVTTTETANQELQRLIQQAWNMPVDLQGNRVAQPGALAAPNPAAATAQGCGTTGGELAARPAGSEAPCPPGSEPPMSAPR